ncbi:MAG: cupin domain-containing protein [Cyanobacteria bacterium SZAS LIN-3]|nr:cupin domain-containing protein [Cyanobacteria bacterium SZAS LIN-3]
MSLTAHKSKTFVHADLGALDQLLQNTAEDQRSKQFLRDTLGLTGMEVSVTAYPPNTSLPFFHKHKQNEELYIILKGKGQMQLDDELIEVQEGSVIRVLPDCSRNLRSGPDSEIVFVCIQARENSLEQCTAGDGIRLEGKFAG